MRRERHRADLHRHALAAHLGVQLGPGRGVVESVKAAADVYAPLSGEVVEVNEALRDDPALANTDPLGAGWFFKMKLSDPSQLDALMDAPGYDALLATL